jgi:hypothetical protein
MALKKDDRIQVNDRGNVVHGYYAGMKKGKCHILLDDGRSMLAGDGLVQPSSEPHKIALPRGNSLGQFVRPSGETTVGKILKPSYTATTILTAHGMVWTLPASRIKPADKELAIAQLPQHAKGDRVETEFTQVTRYGTVTSIRGATMTVRLDGGIETVKGSVTSFRKSESLQETEPPSLMDRWSVTGYKTVAGHDDSIPFVATVCLNKIPVIRASNDGWGGCNRYDQLSQPEEMTDPVAALEADAKVFWEAAGITNLGESADLWLSWLTESRPYNVTAKAYAEKIERAFADLGHSPAP